MFNVKDTTLSCMFDDISKYNKDNINLSDFEVTQNGKTTILTPFLDLNPVIKIEEKLMRGKKTTEYILGWSKFENGCAPETISSSTSNRENGKPSIFSYEVDDNGNISIGEMLFTYEGRFHRCLFNGITPVEIWSLRTLGHGESFCDIKEPYCFKLYPDGSIKEKWFFNPNAKDFKDVNCTLEMNQDLPVFISYHENGSIKEEDYTGCSVMPDIINAAHSNQPFSSRFSFYKPSYIKYALSENDAPKPLKEKIYFFKDEVDIEYIYQLLESFGVDVTSAESIKQDLLDNPAVEAVVRGVLGVEELTKKQLKISEMF